STGAVDHVEIHPCRELVVDGDARQRAGRGLDRPSLRGQYRSLLERLVDGLTFEGMEQAIPLLYDRLPFPADLLPPTAPVVVAQARLTADRGARVVAEADALAEASEWPGAPVIEALEAALGGRDRLDLTELSEGIDLGVRPWAGSAHDGAPALAAEAALLHRGGTRIVASAEGHGSLERALEVLGSAGLPRDEVIAVRADVEEGFAF